MGVMKVIEILASSDVSWEEATRKGVAEAAKTLKHIRSAYVQEHSVVVDDDGKVTHYRVNLKLSFEIK